MKNDNTKPVLDDVGQQDLARQLLGNNADGFDLYIQTENCCSYYDGPSFVQVRVDVPFLVALRKMMDLCQAEKLYDIRAHRFPTHWDSSDPDVDSWLYRLDQNGFSFTGSSDDGTEMIKSYAISLNSLSYWLQGTPIEDDIQHSELHRSVLVDRFRWYGGCLFYAEQQEENEFLENVLDKHPEIAARQVAIEMEARIRDSGVNLDTAVPSRRRKKAAL